MAKMGGQTNRNVRWGKIHTPKRIPWSYTLKEIFSEEFGYIIDTITAGYAPGRKKEGPEHENISH